MNDSNKRPGVVGPQQPESGSIGARLRQGREADSAGIAAVNVATVLARLRAERDAAKRWPMPWIFAVPLLQLGALAWLRTDGTNDASWPATVFSAGVDALNASVLAAGAAAQRWWQTLSTAAGDALPPAGTVTAILVLGAAVALAAAAAVEEHQEKTHAAVN